MSEKNKSTMRRRTIERKTKLVKKTMRAPIPGAGHFPPSLMAFQNQFRTKNSRRKKGKQWTKNYAPFIPEKKETRIVFYPNATFFFFFFSPTEAWREKRQWEKKKKEKKGKDLERESPIPATYLPIITGGWWWSQWNFPLYSRYRTASQPASLYCWLKERSQGCILPLLLRS